MGNRASRVKSYSPGKAEKPAGGKFSNTAASSTTAAGNNSNDDPNYIEIVVGKESEIPENKMKIMKLGDEGEVLIVKQEGNIYALGTKCTHYGAPLDKAALGQGRIRCQWHGACFSIETGDIEDFPGLDSLPCYKVSVKNGDLIVGADKRLVKANKRVKPFVKKGTDTRTFVIVGGGAAGNNCVQTLRENGFSGRIVFIIGEPHLPYDRVKLSKAFNVEVDKITLRTAEYFEELQIDVKLGVKLTKLSYVKKELTLDNEELVHYDKLFLATGASARHLPGPGSQLKNIFTLRTVDDANAISQTLKPESEVIILGASFIGLEAASAALPKVKSVTVVGMEAVPFELILGADVGRRIRKFFEEKGVRFELEQSIVEYRGINGALSSVILKDGRQLSADVCLMGVGVVANTQFLADAGIELQRDRSVEVNEFLQTQMESVYAGGDIAFAPVLGGNATIGHWQLAHYHGRVAALNMIGKETKLNSVPFFWTMLFGKGFRYCGYAPKFSRIEMKGDLEAFSFAAFYIMDSGLVGAVLTAGRDPIASHFGEALHRGESLAASDIDEWLAKYG